MPKAKPVDPQVEARITKESAKAVKAERSRLLGLFKDHQAATLEDPLLDSSVRKSYKRLSTAALAAMKAAPQEA